MNVTKILFNKPVVHHSCLSSLVIVMAWILLLSPVSCSQAHRRGGWANRQPITSGELLAAMKERLNLTEEQATRVWPIIEEQTRKRHEIFESYRGQCDQGRQSLRNAMQELQMSTENQLAAILTDEQMEAFRKMDEERREKRGKPTGGPGRRPGF
jgi:Spy/CpxP family protein refolding chaperone